jgi:hypothetical protein
MGGRVSDKSIQNLLGSMKGRDHLEGPDIDGRTILKWILGKEFWRVWTGFIWFRIGIGGGGLL